MEAINNIGEIFAVDKSKKVPPPKCCLVTYRDKVITNREEKRAKAPLA